MTPSHSEQGHFSTETLQAIVSAAQKDMQNISYALASAQRRGAPTQHWDDRLRQTAAVLNAAMKEMETLGEPH